MAFTKEGIYMNANAECFYHFPTMSTVKDFDLSEQFQKIEEELEEAKRAYYDNDGNEHAVLEMMDLLHAVETWFRIAGMSSDELKLYRNVIISKNRKRGYYDELVEDNHDDKA